MMKLKFTLILTLSLLVKFSYGQLVDRYGINLGASYSKQIYDYKIISQESDHDYKIGLQAFIQGEKDFGKILAVRAELGYIQTGFKNTMIFTASDGIEMDIENENVVLHNIALNLGLKVKPFQFDYTPYLFVGCRTNYMVSYKAAKITSPSGEGSFEPYTSFIKDYNKLDLGGLLAIGLDFKTLFYLEFEYNPDFTKSINDKTFSVQNVCWGVKLGVNINELMQ